MRLFHYSLCDTAKSQGDWQSHTASSFEQFVNAVLRPVARREKDGPAFIPGKVSGGVRKSINCVELSFLVYDFDSGHQKIQQVEAILKQTDLTFVIHQSFSHGKKRSALYWKHYDEWVRKFNETKTNSSAQIVQAYMDWHGHKLDNAFVAVDAQGRLESTADAGGHAFIIQHDPMHKFRVVIPLAENFVLADESGSDYDIREAVERWKKTYCYVGSRLNLRFDPVCADPARLYYRPSYKPGTSNDYFWVFAEKERKPLNLNDYKVPKDFVVPQSRALASETTVSDYENMDSHVLLLWEGGAFRNDDENTDRGKRFVNIIADKLSFEMGTPRADGGYRMLCPFDENHSKPGGTDAFISPGLAGQNPVISCSHTHCQHHKLPAFVSKIMADGKLDFQELFDRMEFGTGAVTKEYVAPVESADAATVHLAQSLGIGRGHLIEQGITQQAEQHAPAKERREELLRQVGFTASIGAEHITTAKAFSGYHDVKSMNFETLTDELAVSRLELGEVRSFALQTKSILPEFKEDFIETVRRKRIAALLERAAKEIVNAPPNEAAILRGKAVSYMGCEPSQLNAAIHKFRLETAAMPEVERQLQYYRDNVCVAANGSEFYYLDQTGLLAICSKQGLGVRLAAANIIQNEKKIDVVDVLINSGLKVISGVISDPTKSQPFHYDKDGRVYLNEFTLPVPECAPVEGDVEPFLFHLREVVCSGEEEIFRWLILFLADCVQNPGKKKSSAVIVTGSQGTGKSTIFSKLMLKIYGDKWVTVDSDGKSGNSGFNATRAKSLLYVYEEASRAHGNSRIKTAHVMKALISSTSELVTQKFKTDTKVTSITRYVLISNENLPIDIDIDDRRYLITKAGLGFRGDDNYFVALHDWIDNQQGPEKVLHYLLQYDPIKDGEFEHGWSTLFQRPPRSSHKDVMLNAVENPATILAELLDAPRWNNLTDDVREPIYRDMQQLPALGAEPVYVNADLYRRIEGNIADHFAKQKATRQDAIGELRALFRMGREAKMFDDIIRKPDGTLEKVVQIRTREMVIHQLREQGIINQEDQALMMKALGADV